MPEAKRNLDNFLRDLKEGKKVGLRVLGPNRGGKTWSLRILEKDVLEQGADVLFVYTKLLEVEPTFTRIYSMAIEQFAKSFESLSSFVNRTYGGLDLSIWQKLIPNNEDLAQCLFRISQRKDDRIARRWLAGEKMTVSQLDKISIVRKIDTDSKRLEVLKDVIRTATKHCRSFLLIVDELEKAPNVRQASILSDLFRDLLDSFSTKFGLVCSFTAAKLDQWYSLGFTQALEGRLNFAVRLDPLSENTITQFLAEHHTAYRQPTYQSNDQLLPFAESGARRLLELSPDEYRYPGYFLPNCGHLARYASDIGIDRIDNQFVELHQNLFRFPAA